MVTKLKIFCFVILQSRDYVDDDEKGAQFSRIGVEHYTAGVGGAIAEDTDIITETEGGQFGLGSASETID